MNATRVSAAAQVILAAQQSRQTAAGIAAALDTSGWLQTPGEVRELLNRVTRHKTAWQLARTRARSAGGAADRYAARARELQHALQDTVGAHLAMQMQRDTALRRLAELDLAPSCDRCRCTEDVACEGGCSWVPNSYGLDVCSACITPDGRCTTPACGQIETPSMFGWILVDVAGSDLPPRFHCSSWCAQRAIEEIGSAMAADDLRASLPEKDTRDAAQAPAGESTPATVRAAVLHEAIDAVDEFSMQVEQELKQREIGPLTALQDVADLLRRRAAGESTPRCAYLARHQELPAPLGYYGRPEAARAHCEAALSAKYPADVALVWDWIEDDEDGVAELVITIGTSEQPTGYSVVTLELPDEYDAEADW